MNSRRNFIRGAVASLAACVMPWNVRQRKYGRITVGVHPLARSIRCYVDGIDVTNRAFDGDDREGWVMAFKRTEDAYFIRGATGKPEVERLIGDVRFEVKA